MNKNHSLVILFVLVIAPMFPMFMVPTANTTSNTPLNAIPAELVEPYTSDALPEEDVELNMMFFTETPSSEDGLYYVCRQGTDSVAYFGASMVKYLSGNTVFTLEFPGSNLVVPQGESPTGSVTNYLLGSDSSQWKSGVEDCAVLRYSEIYPGIDLVYKTQDGNLKYDFVVAPNANPDLIQMSYSDAGMVEVQYDSLTVYKSDFSFSDTGLWAFQEAEEIVDVTCAFQTLDMNTIGFYVGSYDESKELIIDPLLVYSSFLGGSGDETGRDIVVDDGYIYITGYTVSDDFPCINSYNSTHGGSNDCFVIKLAADGQSIIYSTFLGGSDGDAGYGIDVENGYAYIIGITYSADFPVFSANDTTYGGQRDCFVTKLSVDGQSLVYSSYLGGTSDDYGNGIAVESDFAYITGRTSSSSSFPIVNAYQPTYGGGDSDGYVTKFSTDGLTLIYSTFIGGSNGDASESISVESGSVYITGSTYSSDFPFKNSYNSTHGGYQDCFVTKFAADGQSLDFSTLIGGADTDVGTSITVENEFIYITGNTGSDNYPTTVNAYDETQNGNWDVFVTKLETDGQSLVYSTFIGGSYIDKSYAIAVEDGIACITGYTESTDYPVVNAFDPTNNGFWEGIVSKLTIDGNSLAYSTHLGGHYQDAAYGIALQDGSAYVTGTTGNLDFPTVDPLDSTHNGNYDCFISIISDDSDFDSLSDWHEGLYGTNPLAIDSDLDGASDAYEVAEGTDPLDPFSYPSITSDSEYSVAYSSYIAGSSVDNIEAVRVVDGYIYLGGKTSSPNFPMVNAWNSTYSTSYDAFIVKMASDGQSIIFSTFVGGIYDEALEGMDVYDGCVYIAGYTSSPNFPTYLAYDNTFEGSNDAFLFKLAADGSAPEFSTYLGGIGSDNLRDMCIETGNVYVVGETTSTDFPTVNAFDSSAPTSQDVFVTKFAVDGQSLVYSTYLGGDTNSESGYAIAVDDGFAYVGGSTLSSDFPMENAFDDTLDGMDGFLTKLSKDGSSLVYSSYIGGSSTDYIVALSAAEGFAYLTGITSSSDFPLSNPLFPTKLGGAQSGFVARMNLDGSSFMYSTYLTGSITVIPVDIVVDNGFACISGHTDSVDFPVVGYSASSCDGSSKDAFVTKIANDGQSLLYSSCVGGTDADYSRSIDVYDGTLYIAGYTDSDDYPTLIPYNESSDLGKDGFLTIFDIDSDFDELPDFTEQAIGTYPDAVDSDGDNFLDNYEFVYGSDPLDEMSIPSMSQAWYDAIYEDLDGNATLIKQIITWLDGNHTAIETLFNYVEGNATLLLDTIDAVDANENQLTLLAALVSQNAVLLNTLNASHIGDMAEIRAIMDMLGAEIGDTDYDGLDDLAEIALGTDIQCIDTDVDNLNDAYEVKIGTDPLDDDSDDDQYLDGAEIIAGTNPLDPLDYPGMPIPTGTTSTDTTTPTTGTTTPPAGGDLPLPLILAIGSGAAGAVIVVLMVIIRKRRAG